MEKNTFGRMINHYRKMNGITLEELAKKTGVTKGTLSKYEKGIITNVPADKIEKMANALDVTPATLLGWEDSSNNIDRNLARISAHATKLDEDFFDLYVECNGSDKKMLYDLLVRIKKGSN